MSLSPWSDSTRKTETERKGIVISLKRNMMNIAEKIKEEVMTTTQYMEKAIDKVIDKVIKIREIIIQPGIHNTTATTSMLGQAINIRISILRVIIMPKRSMALKVSTVLHSMSTLNNLINNTKSEGQAHILPIRNNSITPTMTRTKRLNMEIRGVMLISSNPIVPVSKS
jgi:hypothetical protein